MGDSTKKGLYQFIPKGIVGNEVTLQKVFGYPPDNLEPRTNEIIKKSMPLVRFFPSEPNFQRGLDLFNIVSKWDDYKKLLFDNGFNTNNGKGDGIQLAFLADNFPTDSFTNEYGENFLQKFTSMASEGAHSIAQIFGAKKASDVWERVQKDLGQSENAAAKMFGGGMKIFGGGISAAKQSLSNVPGIGRTTAAGINLIDRLAAGARIDFPMVWKSSGFQPSYSMTVRLYNPFPQSEEATRRFIIGPIAAIMLLGVPRAEDASTFTWPFLHRIECPGLFTLDPGFISNITVIKGGDQQQISFQQRLGIVDVRIDVGSLYSSMLGASLKVTSRRPTVSNYVQTMAGEIPVSTRVYDNKHIGTASKQETIGRRDVGLTEFGADSFGETTKIGTGRGVGRTNTRGGISPKRAATSFGSDDSPKSRVTAAAKALAAELKKLDPFA